MSTRYGIVILSLEPLNQDDRMGASGFAQSELAYEMLTTKGIERKSFK